MTGLFIPGSIIIGGQNGGAGGCADLSDIDLTAVHLDPRVRYQCASRHAFYAETGAVQYAEPDVWPLEYRDVAIVGRHEPEPQATNLPKWSAQLNKWQNMHTTTTVDGDDYVITATGASTSWARIQQLVALNAGTYTFMAIVKPGTVDYLVNVIETSDYTKAMLRIWCNLGTLETLVKTVYGSITATCTAERYGEYVRVKTTVTISDTDVHNVYFGPCNAFNSGAVKAGDSIRARFVQLESGKNLTSPIITESAAVTRAAAFATIKNPGGMATSVRVSYSDGTTADIRCPADGADISLPQSENDWGTRYITGIQYGRAFK